MDWEQIEKDFINWAASGEGSLLKTTMWFKHRIEAEMPPPPLTEEEKNEFYTTDLTADIKANYGK